MKPKLFCAILAVSLAGIRCPADDITTLDGHKYEDVTDVTVRADGLFFVVHVDGSLKGVKVPFNNLPQDIQKKYHYDGYEAGFRMARENQHIIMRKDMAFSLDQLEAAKKKAKDENKPLGFIMEWDMMFMGARPMAQGGNCALAHFYEVFHNNLVLVFVSHERELGKVPDAVKKGFGGPDEGGWSPNMAVVTADCSQFICEIPLGGEHSDGAIREPIFRQKIAVIKNFQAGQGGAK